MHKFAITAISLAVGLAFAQGAAAADNDVFNRAAKGDLATFGGAARIKGDMAKLYEEQLKLASKQHAKNVILFIGDGMGDSEITAARNFAEGAGGYFKGIDALPISGQYTHYSLDKKTRKPNYVTDSAASATEWATGVKTYNGAIGVDLDEKPHENLIELAKKKGLATGNVTTSEIQDATPAALLAHVTARKCYGPKVTAEKCPTNLLEKGGLGSITEQLIKTRPDVTMGGGMKTFNEVAVGGKYAGKTLLEQAKAEGFNVVTTASEMEKVSAADQKKPLLGLFVDGNMPTILDGPQASLHGNLDKPVVQCEANPKHTKDMPELAAMTKKAIDLLKVNKNGFFLQVESACIDKQAHADNPCGQFGETVQLDAAVQAALEFARKDGNTLVIVTADHSHATQIVYPDAKAPGFTEAVMTKDGAPMAISYGNSEDVNNSGHTGAQLRVAAYGPAAINFMGLTDQSDMFFTIKNALGL
ncbi:MAG: alkaline phosphatase [Succinivibrio sp.]|jgi:alkaline phosphatase|nr:alkaline phosphatase [Succinivibrio sp.]